MTDGKIIDVGLSQEQITNLYNGCSIAVNLEHSGENYLIRIFKE